ncbi:MULTISPECIES: hypothetical protein [Erysipelothrix]|uniref:hypothetical protein n=1 Tax=Erysipelothrix TaxID=1647 RepID=UPI001407C8C3|nr:MULTISPECIES: hypothetical protein [Erysipelothrix]MDV7678448.1 hypothetical protein [Erysipelothrix rhusiopathiae]WMT70148.1 hypothetical protein K0H77_01160 [Erysipelothrix rhusiopathiae]
MTKKNIEELLESDLTQNDYHALYNGLIRKSYEMFYKSMFSYEKDIENPQLLDNLWEHFEAEQYNPLFNSFFDSYIEEQLSVFEEISYDQFIETLDIVLSEQKLEDLIPDTVFINEHRSALYIIDNEIYGDDDVFEYVKTTTELVARGSLPKNILPENVWIDEDAIDFLFREAITTSLIKNEEDYELLKKYISQNYDHLNIVFDDRDFVSENQIPKEVKEEEETVSNNLAMKKLEVGDYILNRSDEEVTLISNKSLGGILVGGISPGTDYQIISYDEENDNFKIQTGETTKSMCVVDRESLEAELQKQNSQLSHIVQEDYLKESLESIDEVIQWSNPSHKNALEKYQEKFQGTPQEITKTEMGSFKDDLTGEYSNRYIITLANGGQGHFPTEDTESLSNLLLSKIEDKPGVTVDEVVYNDVEEIETINIEDKKSNSTRPQLKL